MVVVVVVAAAAAAASVLVVLWVRSHSFCTRGFREREAARVGTAVPVVRGADASAAAIVASAIVVSTVASGIVSAVASSAAIASGCCGSECVSKYSTFCNNTTSCACFFQCCQRSFNSRDDVATGVADADAVSVVVSVVVGTVNN